ncbi:MAG: class I SAM-dependent methyltransferase [bacterium]
MGQHKAGRTGGSFYDGRPYSLLFDRLCRGLHERVAAWVDEGTACVDVCCGTGGLTFQLAARCRRVVGIDYSPRQLARAEQLRRGRGFHHVSFEVGDASVLDGIPDGAFDVATVSMGLHEMDSRIRAGVLPTLLRVASRAVIVDFAVPMPRNLAGLRNRGFELLAGPRHFLGFRDFTRRGGLRTMIEEAGAELVRERRMDGGTLSLVEIRRAADAT